MFMRMFIRMFTPRLIITMFVATLMSIYRMFLVMFDKNVCHFSDIISCLEV